VGVLGDLCRNVETDLLPYCDEIMQLLIHNLGSNDVHRTIKPQVSTSRALCLCVVGLFRLLTDFGTCMIGLFQKSRTCWSWVWCWWQAAVPQGRAVGALTPPRAACAAACRQILATFGDLALVLGDKFEKYLDTVKAMLAQAMHLSIVQVRAGVDPQIDGLWLCAQRGCVGATTARVEQVRLARVASSCACWCDSPHAAVRVQWATSDRLPLLPCALQAANMPDDDWVDYNNELRIGILEAYSGILQGLGPGRPAGGWHTWDVEPGALAVGITSCAAVSLACHVTTHAV
jgi:hypothetical protein